MEKIKCSSLGIHKIRPTVLLCIRVSIGKSAVEMMKMSVT